MWPLRCTPASQRRWNWRPGSEILRCNGSWRRSAVSHAGGRAGGVGLLTEQELTRVLQMLDAIQAKMGIENHENSELVDLEMDTKPEDERAEIARLQERVLRRKKPTP